jgi:carbamoyltransferase
LDCSSRIFFASGFYGSFYSERLNHRPSPCPFRASGFEESAVLVVDGIGSPYEDLSPDEKSRAVGLTKGGWESISLYRASGAEIKAVEKHLVRGEEWLGKDKTSMPTFRSLGGMYSAAAVQIFGHAMEGAGQVMGLAPFGEPEFPPGAFYDIVDGRFALRDEVPARFPHDRRWPDCDAAYKNLARSVQEALEKAILHLACRLRAVVRSDNLCYAGGVALNCVANERIIRESGFRRVFITPAAEDSSAW